MLNHRFYRQKVLKGVQNLLPFFFSLFLFYLAETLKEFVRGKTAAPGVGGVVVVQWWQIVAGNDGSRLFGTQAGLNTQPGPRFSDSAGGRMGGCCTTFEIPAGVGGGMDWRRWRWNRMEVTVSLVVVRNRGSRCSGV